MHLHARSHSLPQTPREYLLGILIILSLIYGRCRVHAQSLAVSLSVGNTYFVVNGWTSPQAMVTVKENAAVVATTQADNSGSFSASVLTEPGLHDYSVYAVDTNSRTTATYTQTVSLSSGTTTTLNNYVLPPTISSTASSVPRSTNIVVSGLTSPSSQVYIFLENSQVVTTTSEPDGSWSAAVATDTLDLASYTLYAKTQVTGGYNSENSSTITVTITSNTIGTTSSSTPNSSGQPTSSPSPQQSTLLIEQKPAEQRSAPFWFNSYDSDHNGVLSLRDITSIVTIWATGLRDYLRGNPSKAATGHCDINSDHKCDLYDFSILLYYIDRPV